MKKQILYSIALSFFLSACSTSKTSNAGGNNDATSQQGSMPTAEKKIEKTMLSDNPNPQPLKGNTPQERAMTKKKVNTNTVRTFEAAPSVPDTL
jgi:hypothetical protein